VTTIVVLEVAPGDKGESPNNISQEHFDEESSKEGDGYSIGGSEI
jgi:hypothetical protein